MPIYEYRRPDGSTFELQQSFSDEPLTVDPDSGVPVQRVLHAPAVHFKGKGFYNTDYGTRNRQRETAAAAAAEKSSAKDGAGSSAKDGAGSSAKDGAGSSAKDSAGSSAKDGAGSSAKEGAGGEAKGGAGAKQAKAPKKDSKPLAPTS